MNAETLKRIEALYDKWCNECPTAASADAITCEVMELMPDLIAAVKERDAAQKALKHLEGEIDATLVGFGDTAIRVREDGGLEDLSASVALSMAKLNHKLKSAQKACAFWIRMAKQCATGTGPNGEYMTADDKCAAIDAAEMAGYADCGKGYHHEREVEPLVEALLECSKHLAKEWDDHLRPFCNNETAVDCRGILNRAYEALARWEKEGK